MRKSILGAATAIVFAAAMPAAAQAQTNFSLGGGVSFPNGDLSDAVNTGFNVQASLRFGTMSLPFGLRVDAGFEQLPYKSEIADANYQTLFGTLDGEYVMDTPGLAPYVVAGVGVYGDRASYSGNGVFDGSYSTDWQTHFGLNGGVGLRLPLGSLNTYVEARLHHVFEDNGNAETIPVTFGIIF